MIYFFRTTDPNKNRIQLGIGLLILVALAYTTPWDNYLVKTGVWEYRDDRVLGKLGYVPYEEYAFFILQTAMTGLWFYFIQKKFPVTQQFGTKKIKYLCALLPILITLLGFYFLLGESTKYFGLILAWATPVILLQWLVGGEYMLKNVKVFLMTILPTTLYLWTIDAVAIHKQVWIISNTQTVGLQIFGLPIEEAAFFLVTNIMIVQGLILFLAIKKIKFGRGGPSL